MNHPFLSVVLAIAAAGALEAADLRNPENQVFQFEQSGERIYDVGAKPKQATLYLWIPENCHKLRGLVVMGTNVPEHMLVGHPAIRDVCRENHLGLLSAVPTFWHFAKEMKGRDAEQVAFFESLLRGLAEESGYPEVASVPWLPVGESGHLLMVCGLIDQRPERCIAGICVKNPHHPQDRTVPLLWTLGTGQEWGQKAKDIRTDWANVSDGFRSWVKGRAETGWPLSVVIEPGTGHFACTDEMALYFAQYISAAVAARVSEDGQLLPVDLDRGFLASLPLPGMDDLTITPYAEATAGQREQAWYFTEELARSAQHIASVDWQARTQVVGFRAGRNTKVDPFSFNSVTEITVTTDDEFSVEGTLLDAVPAGFVGAGEALAKTPREPMITWICGPFSPVGNGVFRIALDRTWKTGAASYLIGSVDSGEGVRRSVQPAAVRLMENKEGAPQTLTFSPIGDLRPDSPPVRLQASSDSGLPVQFTVISGPAVIKEGKLMLTKVPPNARYPVRVIVAAWQWGQPFEPKVKTADMVRQSVLIQKP